MKARDLLCANYAASLFMILLGGFYVIAPILIYLLITGNPLYLKTSALALISLIGIYLGKWMPTISIRFGVRNTRTLLSEKTFLSIILIGFISFILVTALTAPSIPIISALRGLTAVDLSAERGEFLKGREGGWIILLYLSSILTSSVIPYAILLSNFAKSKIRKIYSVVFLVYSSMFLVKALFLNLVLPLVSYGVETNPKQTGRIILILIGAIVFLLAMISLAGFGSLESTGDFDQAEYFTTAYIPSGALDYLVYRAFAIPILSVVDTLHVHATQFGGDLFLGKTSSLISAIVGAEKINIERYVAEYQYGGWNDYANSNVVFFVDGYVNFGWIGVFCFGFIVGQVYRLFARSEDVAFRSLSILFSFQLLSSPLIQMLLSNGWIFLFMLMSSFRVLNSTKRDMYKGGG